MSVDSRHLSAPTRQTELLGAAGGIQYDVANAPTERRSRPASEQLSRCASEQGVSLRLAAATTPMRTDERCDSSNEALDSVGPQQWRKTRPETSGVSAVGQVPSGRF